MVRHRALFRSIFTFIIFLTPLTSGCFSDKSKGNIQTNDGVTAHADGHMDRDVLSGDSTVEDTARNSSSDRSGETSTDQPGETGVDAIGDVQIEDGQTADGKTGDGEVVDVPMDGAQTVDVQTEECGGLDESACRKEENCTLSTGGVICVDLNTPPCTYIWESPEKCDRRSDCEAVLYGDYWQPEWCNAIEGSLSCFVCLMKKPDCASLTYTECQSDLNCVVVDHRLCTAICNPADFDAFCCVGKAFCMPRLDCDHVSGCYSDGLYCQGGDTCVAQLDLYSPGTTPPTDSCRCLDEDECFEDKACEAIPYWGESVAPCEVDGRNFSTNCPFMGCRRATGACPSLDTLIDQCKTYCSYNSFPIDADGCYQCPNDSMACGDDAKASVCQ